MKAYLERAEEHEEFMKQKTYEYKIGKRHLANMMGEDPETFTQEDVDVNIFNLLRCYFLHIDFLFRKQSSIFFLLGYLKRKLDLL